MISGGRSRCVKNFCQFSCFLKKFIQSLWREESRALAEFYPEHGFIRLLQHSRNFIYEIGLRFASQRRSIVRGDRASSLSSVGFIENIFELSNGEINRKS